MPSASSLSSDAFLGIFAKILSGVTSERAIEIVEDINMRRKIDDILERERERELASFV